MNERVLIVDDEMDVVNFSAKVLGRLGYQPETALSGHQALALLASESFDVLITDIMMPEMGGIELLERATTLQPSIAAIVITGFSTFDLALKALHSGAREFLSKPFSIADLKAAVEHALSQARMTQEHARMQALMPLLRLATQTLSARDPETLPDQVLAAAMEATDAAGGAIMIYHTDEPHMTMAALAGTMPVDCDCAGMALAQRESDRARVLMPTRDLPADVSEVMQVLDLGAILCVPLRTTTGFVGVLALSSRNDQPGFAKADQEQISAMGVLAAALLENSRLVTELEAWNRDLEERVDERTRELRQAELQLLRAERLATVGRLGASVAHELRNPLGVISNSSFYLRTRLRDGNPKVAKHLDMIDREVQAANQIITDLMSFVRVAELHTAPSEPNSLLETSLERALIPENVTVYRNYGDNLPPVNADADKLHQVFLNLINNAAQAMPKGGALTVSSEARSSYVQFRFRDTGVGIRKEDMEHIFEPLFTTKAKGIGLGLSIVNMLVEAHHGDIRVSSQVGQGTEFVVRLPVVREEEPVA